MLSVVYDLNFDKEGDENGEITGSARNEKPGLVLLGLRHLLASDFMAI